LTPYREAAEKKETAIGDIEYSVEKKKFSRGIKSLYPTYVCST